MTWLSILLVINLFFAGTLAGVEIASHYGLVDGSAFLRGPDQIRLRQALIRRLRVLVPVLFAPTFFGTIAVVACSAPGVPLALRLVALLGDAFWIYARVVATMRINSDTVDWAPDAPPVGWQGLIAHAERFHIASLWAVTIGFACLLAASRMAAA